MSYYNRGDHYLEKEWEPEKDNKLVFMEKLEKRYKYNEVMMKTKLIFSAAVCFLVGTIFGVIVPVLLETLVEKGIIVW